MGRRRFFVDLFAGCGGLSLGLEEAGFQPVFVNEVNEDAMATYLANRGDHHPHLLHPDFHEFDIKRLVLDRGALRRLNSGLRSEFSISPKDGDLDLVVGGPPCQGFSGIGHRRSYSVDRVQMPSNHLYEDMIYVISSLTPKMFLFENVKGLLSARWTAGGKKGEIWEDILHKFNAQLKGYKIRWALVHAKEYGVPQNRPRVLMVGIRNDVSQGVNFDSKLRADGLLPEPGRLPPDPMDVLGDLLDPEFIPGETRSTDRYPHAARSRVQREYRRDQKTGEVIGKGGAVTEHEYSKHSPRVIEKFQNMLRNNGEIPAQYRTKKFAQRALPERWGGGGPTITVASLPDDYVHYCQPRSLTVREWARLQTFPDWYQFQGKRTTGGVRRAGNPRVGLFARELPKYTQIGNAVPVLLGRAIGEHFCQLLSTNRNNK